MLAALVGRSPVIKSTLPCVFPLPLPCVFPLRRRQSSTAFAVCVPTALAVRIPPLSRVFPLPFAAAKAAPCVSPGLRGVPVGGRPLLAGPLPAAARDTQVIVCLVPQPKALVL